MNTNESAPETLNGIIDAMERQDAAEGNTDDNYEAIYNVMARNNIEPKTREGYNSANKRLILWLFENEHNTIEANAYIKLRRADRTVYNSEKEKKKKMEEIALSLVKDASDSFHPIKLEELTVKTFMKFLLAMAEKNTSDSEQKFLSRSAASGYRSALKDLYRDCKAKVPHEYEEELKQKMKGYIKTSAKEKESRGVRLTEGKDPMTFELYKLLCTKMLEDGTKESVFGRAFLTLTWNLMCRSKNTVYIHRKHISWKGDAMTIQFAHMKCDQEGSEASRKRHIYANPHNLAICCPTAVAIYMMCFPQEDTSSLFSKASYSRFSKYLASIAEKHREEIESLGISIEDIGVHSIRKGAATYCCSGTTCAPHIAAICIRCGWTMGQVKDTYLQYAEAGDQHVGRVVAGLPVLDVKFSTTQPFFKIDDHVPPAESTCTSGDINNLVNIVFPFVVPVSMRLLLSNFLACMLYAYDDLGRVLDRRSFIRFTVLFSNARQALFVKLKSAVTISDASETDSPYFDSCSLTGIPPHIKLCVGQERIIRTFESSFENYHSMMIAELDRRELGGGLSLNLIRDAILRPLEERIGRMGERLENIGGSTSTSSNSDNIGGGLPLSNTFRWTRDTSDIDRPCPEDFKVPSSLPPLHAWQMWHRGVDVQNDKRVRPLKSVRPKDYPGSDRTYKKFRKLCQKMDEACLPPIQGTPSNAQLTEIYQRLKDSRFKHILLPATTAKGRNRTRHNEATWLRTINEFEKRERDRKKNNLPPSFPQDYPNSRTTTAAPVDINPRPRQRRRIENSSPLMNLANTAAASQSLSRIFS